MGKVVFSTKQKRQHMLLMRDWLGERFADLDPDFYPEEDFTVAGFDLSYTSTGYAILRVSKGLTQVDLLETGHFGTSSAEGQSLPERNDVLYRGMQRLLEQHIPRIVAFEAVNDFKNPDAARKVIFAESMLYRAYLGEVPDALLLPCAIGQLKKVAGVSGDKNLVLKGIYKKFGADLNNDDEADAYCAARIAASLPLFVYRLCRAVPNVHQEVTKESNKLLLDFEKRPQNRQYIDEDVWAVLCSMFGSQQIALANDPKKSWEFRNQIVPRKKKDK